MESFCVARLRSRRANDGIDAAFCFCKLIAQTRVLKNEMQTLVSGLSFAKNFYAIRTRQLHRRSCVRP